jgi:hypothetical protein
MVTWLYPKLSMSLAREYMLSASVWRTWPLVVRRFKLCPRADCTYTIRCLDKYNIQDTKKSTTYKCTQHRTQQGTKSTTYDFSDGNIRSQELGPHVFDALVDADPATMGPITHQLEDFVEGVRGGEQPFPEQQGVLLVDFDRLVVVFDERHNHHLAMHVIVFYNK